MMGYKYWWLLTGLLLTVSFAACSPGDRRSPNLEHNQGIETESIPAVDLPDRGPAPELNNDTWLNVDQPLRLAELRGKVVLLDFWTFG